MKLSPRDLNPDPYPPYPTSTYTCRVTIAPRVCGGESLEDPYNYFKSWNFSNNKKGFICEFVGVEC